MTINARVPLIRVLHIVQNLNYGGMERLIADLVRRTDAQRFESHVLALQYLGRFAEDLRQFGRLHTGPRMSRWSNLRPVALARTIRDIAPDVVHTHSGVWHKAGFAARLAGVRRLVHTEHGRAHPDPLSDRIISNLAARRSDVIVAVSEPLRSYLAENVLPKNTTLCVIRNGVDTENIRPGRDDGVIRRELGTPVDRPVIGSIGRLEEVKGYDVTIRAFATLRRRWPAGDPAPVLVIAGDGAQRNALQQLAADLDVSRDVFLLGWRDDVTALHRCFQLFSMSSHSEGTSVSLVEAMSAGICPVVTDVGGNSDVLGPALAHRLVPPNDPEALAAAWYRALVTDARRLSDDAAQARRRAQLVFDIRTMVRAYEDLYGDGLCMPATAQDSLHTEAGT